MDEVSYGQWQKVSDGEGVHSAVDGKRLIVNNRTQVVLNRQTNEKFGFLEFTVCYIIEIDVISCSITAE